MLCRIRIEGVETYCSDLIVEEDSVFLLSVAGYQTAVKATIARLLTGSELTVVLPRLNRRVRPLPGGYRTQFKKLPSGCCQATATAKLAPFDRREENKEFLLVSRQTERVKEGFYSRLDDETDVPLHPSWTEWLWNLFLEEGWIKKLTTLAGTREGYLVSVCREALMDRVATAMREKIPPIVSCLERR